MKKFLLAGIAVAAFCAPAFATDMPVRAPAYKAAPAPYDPWTGFYVGGSVGARWSDVKWRTLDFDANPPPSSIDNPATMDSTSARLGGYLGYNLRIAPSWLAGLEADIAWGNNKKTHTPFPGVAGIGPAGSAGHDFVTAKLGWDGSVRGRLGVLVNPTWLVYGTGGVAWQAIKTSASCDATATSWCLPPAISESKSDTKTGWTVGAGAETALANNWLARVEYRYADFGHVTNRFPFAPVNGFHASVGVKTNTALVGLAYKW